MRTGTGGILITSHAGQTKAQHLLMPDCHASKCHLWGNCTESDYKTMTRRKGNADQDIIIEYTERFPERFDPVSQNSSFNFRSMHQKDCNHQNCSVVHYAGLSKPWTPWSAIPSINFPLNVSTLRILPDSIPEHMYALKNRSKTSLKLWRYQWNQAVTQLQASRQPSERGRSFLAPWWR